jgi:hypothetical protein
LACRFLNDWLGTPVPSFANASPPGSIPEILLKLLSDALTPLPPDEEHGLRERAVDAALLARYHLRRMPLHLLIPHLIHKAGVRRRAQPSSA